MIDKVKLAAMVKAADARHPYISMDGVDAEVALEMYLMIPDLGVGKVCGHSERMARKYIGEYRSFSVSGRSAYFGPNTKYAMLKDCLYQFSPEEIYSSF